METPRVDRWWRRVGPWVGIGTSPAALMTGGGLAAGLHGPRLAICLLAGAVALAALAAAQGIVGQRSGRSLVAVLERPLGTAGARYVAGAVMAAMMLGWFGVNSDAAGTAAARLAGVDPWLGIVAFTLFALVVTVRGIGSLSTAAVVAGAATAVLVVWSLLIVAGRDGAGWGSASTVEHPGSLLHGIGLMVGYGAAFALRAPDFTRDLGRPGDVVRCAAWGLALPLTLFGAVGAAVYVVTGAWNVADMWTRLGSDRIGYIIIAIGFLGSVMTNLFSGALAVRSATRLGPRAGMTAFFVVGVALALAGLADHMLDYLVLMTVTAPGLVVLCVVTLRGRRAVSAWNAAGLTTWGLSTAAGLACAAWAPALALPGALAVSAALAAGFQSRGVLG